MPLTPGTKIGPYEITAPVGAGGMGEVYRALDTNLKRATAIKVLPEAVAADPERLARFQREAEVLAALNHPAIAAIYGLERSATSVAIAMEFVDGPTLADRIEQGALPVEETLAIARQIAEGLEAAHELGIVHRDLKPANIKLRPDGTVKILDFGLAKALEPAVSIAPTASMSPTITSPAMTQMGMVLGTAAYMSPEQARGKPVDKRADIWAFGCVVFELLTGRHAFRGEDITLTFAEIMKSEPDWKALPPLPPAVLTCLRRCLVKDPRQRLRDIGEARLTLSGTFAADDLAESAAPVRTRSAHAWKWALVAAAASGIVATALTYWSMRPAATPVPGVIRFQIQAPPGSKIPPGTPALSPDGRLIAFSVFGADRIPRIHLRDLSTMDTRLLPGTEHGVHPFWSPNGRSLAFVSDRTLKRVDIGGGTARDLAQVTGPWHGAWGPFGDILFTSLGVRRVSEDGGNDTPAAVADQKAGETGSGFPAFLPDGKRFFVRIERDDKSSIQLASLDSPARTLVLDNVLSAPIVAETPEGRAYLLYLRDEALVAHEFDAVTGATIGSPRVLVEGIGQVANPPMLPTISVSRSGGIAYQVGGDFTSMVLYWVSRSGATLGQVPLDVTGQNPALSPDGNKVALDASPEGDRDVWVADVQRGVTMKVTTGGGMDRSAVWSPDGRRIAFARGRKIYVTNADGSGDAEVLVDAEGFPESWSRDGRYLLYRFGQALHLWPFDGGKPVPIGRGGNARWAQFSPDSRAVAYVSNESGRDEVYVQMVPPATGRVQVSATGGAHPRWGRTSSELLFVTADRMMTSVELGYRDGPVAGAAKQLFPLEVGSVFTNTRFDFDAARDRFLIPRISGESLADVPITVVLNWWTELLEKPD